ncbi:MAG: ATP-binding protein [Oscillochloridaceae bacterium umkhey_bin13]
MDETLQPFPFLALVGQAELKTALLLGLINPGLGGILISGPYGVGKTSAVRGLLDLLPLHQATAEQPAVRMRLIELPLNARLEDVVGTLNERVAIEQQRVQLEPGILAHADGNLLYVDEINLLAPAVADSILDAAAQGRTLVRRGAATRLYPSRFVLIGSLNPEEGELRPQILDRFGLRVWVAPLDDPQQRLEVYRRAQAFRQDPADFRAKYASQTAALAEEVEAARAILPHVLVPPAIEVQALALVQALQVPSHRAEIALLEGARARAAADFRTLVNLDDLRRVAPLALRQRQSPQIAAHGQRHQTERAMIEATLAQIIGESPPNDPASATTTLRQIESTE